MEKDNKILDTAIEVEHLKKSFDGHCILGDISLRLVKGENLVILGKSGCGKSVLIKCIVRLMEADEGKIMVLGKNMADIKGKDLNETRKKLGFLFQSAALYDSLSVRENLQFPLRDSHLYSKEEINTMIEEALKNVGLEEAIDKMPSELSGGMRKRLGLARSLMLKPEIMFYDEPTTGLDTITSKEISNLILEVQKKYHTSSVIITHDIECARMTSNRMIVMNEGMFVAEGTFKELEHSENQWVRSFFE